MSAPPCTRCHGEGALEVDTYEIDDDFGGTATEWKLCPRCHGTGDEPR